MDNEGTLEAFSFLRFACASGNEEIDSLPRAIASSASMDGSDEAHDVPDWKRHPLPPVSCRNESAVLTELARLCSSQLARYPTTLAEDVAELESGRWAYGSNKRNALVLLKGEKEVCQYYCDLAEKAVHLFQQRVRASGS
jgi:hypothetical protein